MKLTLPYPPSTNRYYRTDRRGLPHLSDEAKLYRRVVNDLVSSAGIVPFEAAVQLRMAVDVFRPRRAGDLSNRLKVVEDVLQGVAYCNDSQVVEIHMRRFDDKQNPRIEIVIEECVA